MIALLGKGLSESGFSRVESYLRAQGLPYEILPSHTSLARRHKLAFSLGYDRIVTPEYLDLLPNGLVVFHSSDLPQGRGWAPIFYTIFHERAELTVSMIYADAGVDTGPLIAKAKYPLHKEVWAHELLKYDDEIVMILFQRFAFQLYEKRYHGQPQVGEASFGERRRPEQSELDASQSVSSQMTLIRALSPSFPAYFFDSTGEKVFVEIERPECPAFNSERLQVTSYLDQ